MTKLNAQNKTHTTQEYYFALAFFFYQDTVKSQRLQMSSYDLWSTNRCIKTGVFCDIVCNIRQLIFDTHCFRIYSVN